MQEITVSEINARIAQGKQPYILDVREPDEYMKVNNGGHLIPLKKIRQFDLDEIKANREDEIIVMCHSGKRSLLACLFLEQAGFTNVKNMVGGIVAWKKEG